MLLNLGKMISYSRCAAYIGDTFSNFSAPNPDINAKIQKNSSN